MGEPSNPMCRCAGTESATCQYITTCGRKPRRDGETVHFADSNDGSEDQQLAVRSVGALVVPDSTWASAFVIAPSVIITAGHVFVDSDARNGPLDDRQSADQRVLVMNLEAASACAAKQTFMLDPLHASNAQPEKFARRHDAQLDYAICRVAQNAGGQALPTAPVNVSPTLPKVGDVLYVIHHAYFARVKQITQTRCRRVDSQRIYVDKQIDTGASGGLIVNESWQAIGLFVDGMSGFPFGYLLGPIARDVGTKFDVEGGLTEHWTRTHIPGQVDALSEIRTPRPPPAKSARVPLFGGWARHVRGLANPIKSAFDGVAKVYSRGVEAAWAKQGTAFVVAESWVLTAHHVASCPEEAEKLLFDFEYVDKNSIFDYPEYRRPQGQFKAKPTDGYFASGDGFESCDGARYHLDYALMKITTLGASSCPDALAVTSVVPTLDTEIFIVQHANVPELEHKGVLAERSALDGTRNLLKKADDQLVYHLAARSYGTSGAPILNVDGQVFAMHTHEASAHNEEFESDKRSFSWGVRLSAIAKDLKIRNPTICDVHPELTSFIEMD